MLGQLQTGSGEFDPYFVTTLRWPGPTVSQMALLDHPSGKQYTDQLRAEGNTPVSAQDGLAFLSGAWQSSGAGPVQVFKLAGKGVDLKLVPVIRHSQITTRASTPSVHWTGAVKLSRSLGGKGEEVLILEDAVDRSTECKFHQGNHLISRTPRRTAP